MGRYVGHSLTLQCKNLEEMRQFLRTCRWVSDDDLFGKDEYWQPPDEFEKRKAGDCEDFALWTWRQLLGMGLDARVVFGTHGRYGIGHAWVEYFQDGKCFLLEPQCRNLGMAMPRLSTLNFEPKLSVSWDGKTIRYFSHKDKTYSPDWALVIKLIPQWIAIWGLRWLRILIRLPYLLVKRMMRSIKT